MPALADLDEAEAYLYAILQDQSGIDQAEFTWTDDTSPDSVFRCYDYQYEWYRDTSKFQIDQCVSRGSLVLTARGHVPIEEIRVGDVVLTHAGNWKPVTCTFDRGERDVVRLTGSGHPGLVVTEDHKFYTQPFRRSSSTAEPTWTRARDMRFEPEKHDRWASPTCVPAISLPTISERYPSGRTNNLEPDHLAHPYFWWLVGLYVAEGSVSSSYGRGGKINRATFSVNNSILELVRTRLDLLGFKHNTSTKGQVTNVVVNSLTLAQYLMELGGKGAGNKHLHPAILGLDEKFREAVFEGAQLGDGYATDDGAYTYSTISRALAFDMRLLALGLGMQAAVAQTRRDKDATRVIEGRTVRVRSRYAVRCSRPPTNKRLVFDGHHAWGRVFSSSFESRRERVYDIEVADDHSFVVEGIVVHNCGRAVGKALDVATPVPTPGGWTTMGELEVDDLVYAPSGVPVRVTHAFEVRHGRPCYTIHFDDGETIVADADHLWTVSDGLRGLLVTYSTQELLDQGSSGDPASFSQDRFSIDVAEPITGPCARPPAPHGSRSIVAITPAESRPVRCISVDSDDHLFLVGRGHIATHNSVGMQMRAWAFPFTNPGEEMLLTAPELIHLDPVTRLVEDRVLSTRMSKEFLQRRNQSNGITHRPFEARFRNGSRIVGRIPQKDGRGVKGSADLHSITVTADRGLIPVSELTTDDYVLTHRGNFRRVLHIYRYETEALEVAGAGHRGMVVSENHRFYARRNSNPQRARNLGLPTWAMVDDPELSQRWYWATPTEFPLKLELPEFPLPEGGSLDSLMWMCGHYVADGSCGGTNKRGERTYISICDSLEGVQAFAAQAALAGYEAKVASHDGTAHARNVYSTGLAHWMMNNFGRRSEGKTLPAWLLGAPTNIKERFLEGYLHGDGHWNKGRERWEISTASRALAIGIKLLGQSLGYGATFSWVDPKQTHVMGVELKNKSQRSYRVQLTTKERAIVEDGMTWGRIRKVTPVDGPVEVVDVVVEEDFSYVADGIVHKGSRFTPDQDERF